MMMKMKKLRKRKLTLKTKKESLRKWMMNVSKNVLSVNMLRTRLVMQMVMLKLMKMAW
jgi:hypothetical protein